MSKEQDLKRGARIWRRLILGQAFFIVAGWWSLVYGWGMEPRNWYALGAYLLATSIGWPLSVAWINLERRAAMSKSAMAGMDRQRDQAEAERLLCAIVIAGDLDFADAAVTGEAPGHDHPILPRSGDGAKCATCRAWRQAREYVLAIQAGRETAGKAGK